MGDLARNYKVDAIEVLNGGSTAAANNEAKELAKSYGFAWDSWQRCSSTVRVV